jgi:glycosyltransferase involved in cell wall biosynthesis
MDWPETCAVVIPCLNEEAGVGRVVSAARLILRTVIVIDDGSTDGTARVAEAAGAIVLRHAQPQGKGAALRAGWDCAARRGKPWALCMDGDGQHAPEDIPAFLARASRGDVALVVGERMHAPEGMPLVRRATNRFMSWQLSRVAGVKLSDTQCGFRLMNLAASAALPLRTECFEIESEVLVQFARAGLGIAFVPIQVIYAAERSKIRPVRDAFRWWRWMRNLDRAMRPNAQG